MEYLVEIEEYAAILQQCWRVMALAPYHDENPCRDKGTRISNAQNLHLGHTRPDTWAQCTPIYKM
jgi:hypothetical protein